MFRSTLRLLQRPSPSLASYTRRNLSFAFPSPRKLNEITDLALLSQESPENVKTIWNIYYEDQVHAHGVTLTAAQHEKIISRAKTCGMFIFPVLKDDGHMWVLSQFQDTAFIVTFLGEYQQDPATAKPWLSCVLYDNFIESKDLALVRSDFLPSLTKSESITLTNMIMAMYHNDEGYNEYVTTFNQKPEEFNFEQYLEEFKTRKEFVHIKEE